MVCSHMYTYFEFILTLKKEEHQRGQERQHLHLSNLQCWRWMVAFYYTTRFFLCFFVFLRRPPFIVFVCVLIFFFLGVGVGGGGGLLTFSA
jgi:hypothetical protein